MEDTGFAVAVKHTAEVDMAAGTAAVADRVVDTVVAVRKHIVAVAEYCFVLQAA